LRVLHRDPKSRLHLADRTQAAICALWEGLVICDKDEREIDAHFVSCRLAFGEDEVKDLLAITTCLNNRCQESSRPESEITGGAVR
jgi:hypothetical protein